MKSKFHPDKSGYFGQFGGAFVPELLFPNVKELEDNYIQIIESEYNEKVYKVKLLSGFNRNKNFYIITEDLRNYYKPSQEQINE